MKAAHRFASILAADGRLATVTRVRVELFGSLGLTGLGHSTDRAVTLGLAGFHPAEIEPDQIERLDVDIRTSTRLHLAGSHAIDFDPLHDIVFHSDRCHATHPNVLTLSAECDDGRNVFKTYASIGGGFIRDLDTPAQEEAEAPVPFPFESARQLLHLCNSEQSTIARLAYRNEAFLHGEEAVWSHIDRVAEVMMDCIDRGLAARGTLPGGLDVERRARSVYLNLVEGTDTPSRIPGSERDWATAFALAVSEENAAGGRVVTAPTNGAAGIIPAVLRYYRDFVRDADALGVRRFLLTAGAIGSILTQNAGISGAELGCQAEIGSACAMAAAGLAAVLGGTPAQVENAAEIALEHFLGLTCDPVMGLVQVPCIERNAVGTNHAITAASLALRGTGRHIVSLDMAIETMRQTGLDMSHRYKETSLAGLAVNYSEC